MNFIEILILVNVYIHFELCVISGYVASVKISKKLLFLSILLDVFFVILNAYFPYQFEPYKYIFIVLISIIPSVNKGGYRCLFFSLIYLMLNFTLGGITDLIYNVINNIWALFISLFLIGVTITFIIIYKRQKVNYDKLFYEVSIEYESKVIKLKGFCDTGNFLQYDDMIPIVLINDKYKMGSVYKQIKLNTINFSSNVDMYKVDKFIIKINNKEKLKDVYVVYISMKYDAMFGIEILGG